MADKAHRATDDKLEEMEKRLSAIYSEAQEDIQRKANEYFAKFEKADAEKRKLVKAGKLTEDEYKTWRQNKIMYGKRFTAMKEDIAKQLLNVNQTATAYINGELPEVYALNYNALEKSVDGVGGYSFTLVDADTVRELATTDKSLLPFRELDPAKDIPWNMKAINSEVLQGIIQGESIPDMSKRIFGEIMKTSKTDGLTDKEMGALLKRNKDAAIRSARTIVTGAENKGRMDSYQRAQDDGIILEKKWLAAIDKRTRDWHVDLNGVSLPIDKPFHNDFGDIMFPGDPTADGANVYNCRCTLVSKVKGFKKNAQKTNADVLANKQNPYTLGEDYERLVSSGRYDIQSSGGYTDRSKVYTGIDNLDIKQKVDEMAGPMPAFSGKYTKKYITESIAYQERLREASLMAEREYLIEAEKAKSEGAKVLFAKKAKWYAENAKEAEKMIEWLKRLKK